MFCKCVDSWGREHFIHQTCLSNISLISAGRNRVKRGEKIELSFRAQHNIPFIKLYGDVNALVYQLKPDSRVGHRLIKLVSHLNEEPPVCLTDSAGIIGKFEILIMRVFWNRNQDMWEVALTLLSAGVVRIIEGSLKCLLKNYGSRE